MLAIHVDFPVPRGPIRKNDDGGGRSRIVVIFTATPAVRRLAREIGVDITAVTGTGEGGRILLDDVKATGDTVCTPVRHSPCAAIPSMAGVLTTGFCQPARLGRHRPLPAQPRHLAQPR